MTDTKRPREFYLYPVIGENFDNLNQEWIVSYDNDGRQTIHVREVIEGELTDADRLADAECDISYLIARRDKYKSLASQLAAVLECCDGVFKDPCGQCRACIALAKYREATK